jgi:peptidylprolyl isomerase
VEKEVMNAKPTHTGYLRLLIWCLALVALTLPLPTQALPKSNAITDGSVLLRLSLPLREPSLKELDESLFTLDQDLKYNRWSFARRDADHLTQILTKNAENWIATLPIEEQAQAQAEAEAIKEHLHRVNEKTKLKSRGKSEARQSYEEVSKTLTLFENHWAITELPFQIPSEYDGLPRLLGRATVELDTTAGSMTVVLDGYSAPLTAGNFADLVKKGFYDGLPFDRVENFFLIQAGDPPGNIDGYLDPLTGEIRTIPMEILLKGDSSPVYGLTLEQTGRWDAEPLLPFSAEGAIAMARYPDDPNSASSQFFIFFAEPDLTPAGLNLMDGRYAVFGYVTQGLETIHKIKLDDRILQARLVSGEENLFT